MWTDRSVHLSLQPPPQKPPAPSMPASAPPMKPTFPAYSSTASSSTPPMTPSATISAAPTIKKPESSSGLTIKLVHPHEDISLVCLFVVLVCRWHCRQVCRVEYLFIILKVCLHVTFFAYVRFFHRYQICSYCHQNNAEKTYLLPILSQSVIHTVTNGKTLHSNGGNNGRGLKNVKQTFILNEKCIKIFSNSHRIKLRKKSNSVGYWTKIHHNFLFMAFHSYILLPCVFITFKRVKYFRLLNLKHL